MRRSGSVERPVKAPKSGGNSPVCERAVRAGLAGAPGNDRRMDHYKVRDWGCPALPRLTWYKPFHEPEQ